MDNFKQKKTIIFQGSGGGPTFSGGGGVQLFQGGSNYLFPRETHIACDFSRGPTLCPSYGSTLEIFHLIFWKKFILEKYPQTMKIRKKKQLKMCPLCDIFN